MYTNKKNYDEIVREKYDFGTGISTVVTDNIKMILNEHGEYVPTFLEPFSTFDSEKIEKLAYTCSSLSPRNEYDVAKSLFSSQNDIKFDERIGFYNALYAGYVIEGHYRKNGSSGGFATWILKELLEQKYVDYVINVKATQHPEKLFSYSISKSVEEIIKGSKTKYYPVELSEVLKIVKEVPGKYAIIGLPSFIMELRLLSEIDETIKERITFMIGLVCGHQKSSKFADILAWQCGIKPGELKSIDFRKKIENQPSSSYGIEVTGTIDGEEVRIVKEMKELYGGDWGKGLFKIRASDFTDDVMNETADITLGDAWLPEYTMDSEGNNIVIIRNPIIKRIVEKALTEGRIKLDEISVSKIIESQAAHYRHTQEELPYRLRKKEKRNEWIPKKRVDIREPISFIRKRIQDVRENICLKAPIHYDESVKRNNLDYFMKKCHYTIMHTEYYTKFSDY